MVATQSLARNRGIGVFFTDIPDLGKQLRDRDLLAGIREEVWRQRLDFSFDAHADDLVDELRDAASGQHRFPPSSEGK